MHEPRKISKLFFSLAMFKHSSEINIGGYKTNKNTEINKDVSRHYSGGVLAEKAAKPTPKLRHFYGAQGNGKLCMKANDGKCGTYAGKVRNGFNKLFVALYIIQNSARKHACGAYINQNLRKYICLGNVR